MEKIVNEIFRIKVRREDMESLIFPITALIAAWVLSALLVKNVDSFSGEETIQTICERRRPKVPSS